MIQNIKLYLLENNTGQIPGVKENPRDLTGDGFAKAKQSIKDFPEMLEVRTLVAVKHEDRFVVIGGNQRLRAMRDLDHDTAPVMVVDWPVDKINEFIIKDNVEYGVWNFDLLANEWDSNLLVDWGMNLPVDFGDVDDSLIGGQSDVDDVPEAPEVPKSKLGDIWICGKHRVMCGDSTSIDAVERLMDGQKADFVLTDPPYNQETDGGFKGEIGASLRKQSGAIAHLCNFEPETLLPILPIAHKKGIMNATIFCNKDLVPRYLNWAVDNKYSFNILVWKKPSAIPLGGSYLPDVEYCLVFRRSAKFNTKQQGVSYSKVLEYKRETGLHPTMKPVDMLENQVKIVSDSGDLCLDLFGGSGSTLIACEKTGRNAFLMELDEKYVDVIINRWQDFTGKDAILESTQQKFNEL